MDEATKLDDRQAKALLDILSHHEVYQEILDFRKPDALSTYGPPFDHKANTHSTSPSLQSLVSRFFLTLPGLRDVSKDFWKKQVAALIEDLEKAELSESYDKGHLGIRKTLATAISALVEYPVRGVFAGFDRPDANAAGRQYNMHDAADLQQAFKDAMQQTVYGNLVDDVFAKTAETDKLADHTPMVQAMHEFGLVNMASFMHFILIKSPKGQQLLALIERSNRLVPYTIIRQTLKIGNVASMINAMVRVVLAKMSVASVTNWMGLTQSSDEGMNLLQNIISQVLQWDIRDLRSRTTKIEKSKQGPSKEQLHAIKAYPQKSRQEHEKIREMSIDQSKSIVTLILQESLTPPSMSPTAHEQALDYLAITLSIRDRNEIIRIFCHSHPDHLTQSVRDLVAAYEPMIRHVHNAVDLSDTVYDFELFLRDMIKLAKLPEPNARSKKDQAAQQPTVGDFVQLLKKHQSASHKFLHQVAKNDKELAGWFHEYAQQAAAHFKQSDTTASDATPKGAGNLTQPLQDLFSALPAPKQKDILPIVNQQALYLSKLHAASAARLRTVVSSPSSNHPALSHGATANTSTASTPAPSPGPSRANSLRKRATGHKDAAAAAPTANEQGLKTPNPGPGAYLARWQALLDGTLITPAEAEGGRVRGGGSASVRAGSGVGVDAGADADAEVHEMTSDEATTTTSNESASAHNNGKDHEEDLSSDDEDIFHETLEGLDELGLDPDDKVAAPDVGPVVEALGVAYREVLGRRGVDMGVGS